MPGYISEIDYEGGAAANFIEIAVPKGTDTSGYSILIYKPGGTIQRSYSLGSSVQTVDQKDVYLLDNNDTGWKDLKANEAVALVDGDGNVLQFISFEGNTVTASEGAADGMTSTSIGTIPNGSSSLETFDEGSSYSTQANPNPGAIPCFAAGTLIETPGGWRGVETLRPGDRVRTLDHRAQRVIRVFRSVVSLQETAGEDRTPVLIRPGALGPGRPARDLVVSPQHRILVGGQGQLEDRFPAEHLVPAKALTVLPGIRRANGKHSVTWIHLLCETHEVLSAAGAWTESLLMVPMVLNRMTRLQRRGLRGSIASARPARPLLGVGEARRWLKDPRKAVAA